MEELTSSAGGGVAIGIQGQRRGTFKCERVARTISRGSKDRYQTLLQLLDYAAKSERRQSPHHFDPSLKGIHLAGTPSIFCTTSNTDSHPTAISLGRDDLIFC